MMKRTAKIALSLLVILSILACFAACGSKVPSGKYNLSKMDAEGFSMDADMLKEYGMEITIEFNSDGTGTLTMMDDEEDFEWKDNKIIADGEEMTFKLSGSTLTIESEEGTMVFEK